MTISEKSQGEESNEVLRQTVTRPLYSFCLPTKPMYDINFWGKKLNFWEIFGLVLFPCSMMRRKERRKKGKIFSKWWGEKHCAFRISTEGHCALALAFQVYRETNKGLIIRLALATTGIIHVIQMLRKAVEILKFIPKAEKGEFQPDGWKLSSQYHQNDENYHHNLIKVIIFSQHQKCFRHSS